jgi:hypothetical protein
MKKDYSPKARKSRRARAKAIKTTVQFFMVMAVMVFLSIDWDMVF